MAFYQEEEELEDGQPTAIPGGAPLIGDSGSTGSAQAAASPARASAPTGRFTGINQYLEQNKSQADNLGNQVSGIISDQSATARQDAGVFNQAAESKIKAPTLLDQNSLNTIQSGAENLNDDQKKQIKSNISADYTGPKNYYDISEYQTAADSSKKANEAIDGSKTDSGRFNLLSQINEKPRNQGINSLDNVLLSAGGGKEKLEQSATQNKDLSNLLSNSAGGVQQKIGGAIGQTQAAQTQASDSVTNALNSWREGFNPKVQLAQQSLIDKQDRVAQDISGTDRYSLTPETMGLLGLKEGDRTYGLNLNSYIQQASPNDINASNVASSQDYARYLALSDLSGEAPTILQSGNESLSGTAPTLKGNAEKLAQDREASKSSYRSQQLSPLAGTYSNDGSRDQLINAIYASNDPNMLKMLDTPMFNSQLYTTGNHRNRGRTLTLREVVADLKIASAYRRQYDRTKNSEFLRLSEPSINSYNNLLNSGMFDNLMPGIKTQK